ncbi:hypothetical protein WICMUC_004077 [Wickerhamomyces mucosus]|uniref:Glycerophosphodiester phosphodiesterase n=1 Tax=Wickerhamomyces mucosus TaxID=1378264 RepID=A0A9P8PJP1_9ASCO|nr:hypothetical protein WICMUC_004077 [Wickerhamomyces mucosus]
MKFGKTIANHQVPEWSHFYMNYKDLKKQIKLIVKLKSEGKQEDTNAAIAGFFFSLDRNIETVDEFYNRQYLEYNRRFKKISSLIDLVVELEADDLEEIASILLELRSCFRNLKWYGELNKRGFVKILKKLDKKTSSNHQIPYLNSRINPLLFANESEIIEILASIDENLNKFQPSERVNRSNGKSGTTDLLVTSILNDNATELFDQLCVEYKTIFSIPSKVLISLLNKSAINKSFNCITKILETLSSLGDPSDISGRNFFHHHMIALGRQNNKPVTTNVATLLNLNYKSNSSSTSSIERHDTSPESLLFILERLPPHLRPALLQRDHYKRTPLHYSSKYGLVDSTKIIIEYLIKWNEWNPSIAIDNWKYWGDSEFLTPLHLAILSKHPETVEVLIKNSNNTLDDSKSLILATRLDSPLLLKILLGCKGIDINFKDDNDETSLFIASKLNFIETVEFLLNNGADPEIKESSFGWTPIVIASVEGFLSVVKTLKNHGAIYSSFDDSGWLPMEHACLRGHLEIADELKPVNYDPKPFIDPISIDNLEIKSNKQLVKSFGHRYLKGDESVIIITLGSNDTRFDSPAIQLDRVPISKVHATKLDTALSLIIRRKDEVNDPPIVVDLPIDEVEPLTINSPSNDPTNDVIFFDIVPTYGGQQVLGRGVASVKDLFPKVGPNKTLLNKSISIPIIETETLDVLGKVNFELLVVTPFVHPNMALDKTETYWKSLVSTRVIGHRGLGKNSNTQRSLQLGENTVESFIAAASLGASYVEFDVQLTKDSEPVIYHDFLVAESGIDIPMHELTLEQFLNLNEVHKQDQELNRDRLTRPNLVRTRSSSHSSQSIRETEKINRAKSPNLEKMKLTRTYKVTQGFKGNSKGLQIASSFTTLKELFKKIPKNVGFNIECKYPLLYELQDEGLGEVFVELNHWIDTVLKVVFDYADGRDIIFSSFHPEACLLLSLKQPSIPILFLTESGTTYMPDLRTDSLQSAIRFSKKWNLLGIVSESKPILKCPRLASVVKQSGLVCFTYGSENNNPNNSKIQMNSGVDAVIVDNVLAVRKELTKDSTTKILTY